MQYLIFASGHTFKYETRRWCAHAHNGMSTCRLCDTTCYPTRATACDLVYVGIALFFAALVASVYFLCCCTRKRSLNERYAISISRSNPLVTVPRTVIVPRGDKDSGGYAYV